MFALLTNYLLQNRKVTIPSIGQFEITTQPATLEFSEKLLYPPKYDIVFTEKEDIDSGLVEYISQRQHLDRRTAEDSLKQMGQKLKDHLSNAPLHWQGIGELSRKRDQVFFQPALNYPAASPVIAEKVFREHQAHTVLIGDREFQKTTEVVEVKTRRTFPAYMIVACTILILALLFILWYLYTHNWQLPGSGWNGLENL